MKTAFVAGAAGFLGSNLTGALLSNNFRVFGLDNFATSNPVNLRDFEENPNFHLINSSVLDSTISQFDEKLDYVFHFASPASPPKYQALGLETLWANTIGTENLIKLSIKHSARFLFASTSEVYGDPLESPQSEGYWGNVNPIGPRSVYDESKRLGETLVYHYQHRSGLNGSIVRIFNTYGPGMDPEDGRVVSSFLRQALAGKPLQIYGDGKQTRSFCFVDDLIDGVLKLAMSNEFGPINLGNPKEFSILELAENIASTIGVPVALSFSTLPEDDPKQRCPDISLAKARLNWEPKVPLIEGLMLTADWMKKYLSGEIAPKQQKR